MAFPVYDNGMTLYNPSHEQDYLVSRIGKRQNGQADLVVVCHGGSSNLKELDPPQSESVILSNLISFVEQSGAKYAALYVSNPFISIQYPSYREIGRFLDEDRMGMSLKTKTQNSYDHQIRYQNQSELVGFGSYLCFSAKMLVERDFDLIGMKVDTGFIENLSKSGSLFVRSSDFHALARLNELRVSDNLFAFHTELSLQLFHVHLSHQPPRLRERHRTNFIFIFIIIVAVVVAVVVAMA
ncbi:hypothetical protein SO802_019073 [Lithocarpus litseifolius]|uniref:Uncharacterized protein n=1 Tax=Lithocarpus litseifolius TaxID=425828 RepID=A0AAW2CMN5_9ROSI